MQTVVETMVASPAGQTDQPSWCREAVGGDRAAI